MFNEHQYDGNTYTSKPNLPQFISEPEERLKYLENQVNLEHCNVVAVHVLKPKEQFFLTHSDNIAMPLNYQATLLDTLMLKHTKFC